MQEECPFCLNNNQLRVDILHEDELWYIATMEEGSINNAVMAITQRHIETPFEINDQEWSALHNLLFIMKGITDEKEKPDGYNLGWNVGKIGGQNVLHAHLHLLARYIDEPLAGRGIRYAFKQQNNRRPGQKNQ